MDGLRLWNRLGSANQVRSSDVGPDGTYLGGGSFRPGRFGAGFSAGATEDGRVLIPKEGAVNPSQGAIEFWGKIEGLPDTIGPDLVPFFVVDETEDREDWSAAIGYSANNGIGGGGLVGRVAGHGAGSGDFGFWRYADVLPDDPEGWHHYALVWDADGVANVGDGREQVALFLDGAVAFAQSDADRPLDLATVGLDDTALSLLYNSGSHGRSAIDNLKIWDFAKTDFSDRFVEGYTLVGTPGADRLAGSVAGDDIRGLGGSDTLLGLGGNDLLRGDAGADLLRGGAGRDVLLGGAGDDRFYGDCGFDDIFDGAGRDALWGGGAADVFHFAKDGQLDRICDFGVGDRIDLSAWGVDYHDLRIRDLPDGRVRIATGAETLDVSGRSVDAADMTEDRFIFADAPDLDWVQWRKADGGNGHWYALVERPNGIAWTAANAEAEALEGGDGHLVSLTGRAENDFVYRTVVDRPEAWNRDLGPHIGLRQSPTGAEPAGGWGWTTGEAATFLNWEYTEPNDLGGLGPEEAGHFYNADGFAPKNAWNDIYDARDDIVAYIAEIDDPLAFG